MTRVLIISHDVVDARMAGPGIRYWHFARVLSREFEVTLAVPGTTSLRGDGFALRPFTLGGAESLAPLVAKADVVVTFGYLLHDHPELAELEVPLVIDAYIPYPFEVLAQRAGAPLPDQVAAVDAALEALLVQFQAGHFFLCATEKQRDLWLGLLLALGRINPHTYGDDPTLRRLIDVVPFGLRSEPPQHTKAVLRGVIEGIGRDDRIVLWGGGIWQWLDPLTLIRAMAQVVQQRPEVKLVFPGTRHPFQARVPDMLMRHQAMELAEELGLLDRWVFFGDWAPYADWPSYLLEADVGVSLHFRCVETEFAFRTRVLDYIWAGLPMVVTTGDAMAELVEEHNLGLVVEPEDVDGVARALQVLLDTADLRETYGRRFEAVRPALTWEAVVEPLARFCRQPRRAPDGLDRARRDRQGALARLAAIRQRLVGGR